MRKQIKQRRTTTKLK